jgi:hypothetical protein
MEQNIVKCDSVDNFKKNRIGVTFGIHTRWRDKTYILHTAEYEGKLTLDRNRRRWECKSVNFFCVPPPLEAHKEGGGTNPLILNLGARWRRVVSFKYVCPCVI